MRTPIRPLATALLLGGLLAGCSAAQGTTAGPTEQSVSPEPEASAATTVTASAPTSATAAEALAANLPAHDAAQTWDAAEEVSIELADGASTSSGDGVTIIGDTVTISAPGTYRLSGALSDGQVVVSSTGDGVVRLVLDGVDLTSSTTSPLAFVEADEAVVVLADGSENQLADAARTLEDGSDEPDAGLYSTADLTITGEGSLDVLGSTNDGIASSDGLVIDSGSITVDAVDDGIRGKDYLVVHGGDISVTAQGDGLKADNDEDATAGYVAVLGGTVTTEAGADGLDAATDVVVGGGTVDVTSGGGSTAALSTDDSAKGLKANVSVVIDGGAVTVDAADDAVHSDQDVTIAGGELVLASGDDGLHAEEELTVSAGTVSVTGSYEALEAATISIAGGDVTLVASDDGINGAGGDGTAAGMPMEQAQAGAASTEYSVTITGGTVTIDAGGDGLDSNGTVDMSGGTVVVSGPTESMNGALDVDGELTTSGGVLLAVGSPGMAMAPSSDSPQASVLATFDTQAAGTVVQVVSAEGDVVAAFESGKSFGSLVLSSPEVVVGETYDVVVGGATAGTATAELHDDGDLTGASVVASVVAGDYAAGGMFGGGPGGRPGGAGGAAGEPSF
ncbi:carbohydrate-binding domain-containing protein [Georgenia sp. MJ206]|uniref:carbohydrate-binding domain-containing protein n=1 Tax=Georgenia wangjunii TaxID=3117730 RepID=UPI002F263586